jgi:hypothetical protein
LAKKLIIFVILLSVLNGLAQVNKRNYRQRELGLFGGASYYLGDLNPRGHFLFSHPAAGIFFRYSTHYRYAFRLGFNYGSLSASDSKSSELDQLERNMAFESKIYDFNAIAEFNFVDYRIGNDKHYFTMFIFAGIGGFSFNPQTSGGNANLFPANKAKPYSTFQLNLPFGVGIKWNIHKRFGLGLEWGPRKLFTDYLDGVSGVANNLSNGIIPGTMLGNPRTKDWYFMYGVTLSYVLPGFKRACYKEGF